jgi:hypothetical protein
LLAGGFDLAANYLEQLLAEWYEYRGYFLRRNVLVGKRKKGGYECELDIVGFHPRERHLLHVEPSMDAMSWEQREQRFRKKFEAGKQYIHQLFDGLDLPDEIDHRAVFVFASTKTHQTIGGGRVVHVSEVLQEIFGQLKSKSLFTSTIPEHLAILRSFQFVAEYRDSVFAALGADQ